MLGPLSSVLLLSAHQHAPPSLPALLPPLQLFCSSPACPPACPSVCPPSCPSAAHHLAAVAKQQEPAALLCELPGHLLCLEGDSGEWAGVRGARAGSRALAAREAGEGGSGNEEADAAGGQGTMGSPLVAAPACPPPASPGFEALMGSEESGDGKEMGGRLGGGKGMRYMVSDGPLLALPPWWKVEACAAAGQPPACPNTTHRLSTFITHHSSPGKSQPPCCGACCARHHWALAGAAEGRRAGARCSARPQR